MAFKSNAVPGVTTDTAVTPTVNAGETFTIIGLSIANNGSTAIDVTVKLVKNGGTTAHVVKDAVVLAGGAIIAVGGDQKLVLEEGDSVTATSSTSGQADAIVSYLV